MYNDISYMIPYKLLQRIKVGVREKQRIYDSEISIYIYIIFLISHVFDKSFSKDEQ